MDFIVSKVAMSICALTVASVLGAFFGDELFVNENDELERILADLSATAHSAILSQSEGAAIWRVPFLSNGDTISMSVDETEFRAICGEEMAILRPPMAIHTWSWDGTELNESAVEALSETSRPACSSSGHALEITTRLVSYENDQKLLAFVSYCA